MNKARIFFFLKFIISFGLLIALLWIMRHNIGEIIEILKNADKLFFTLALAIALSLSLGLSFRLKFLMSGQGISLHLKDVIYLTFIGYFFNNFFPTAIGGDVIKAHYAFKKTNNRSASYAAIIADRLTGFISTLSIAIIGIIFVGKDFGNKKIVWALIGMVVLVVLAISMLLNSKKIKVTPPLNKGGILAKITEKFSKLYSAINFYRHHPLLLIKTYVLAVVMQAGAVLSIYFFILCLGGNMHFLKLFLVVPVVWAISMLPSLNGLGVREGAFVYFLKADIGPEMAFAISFLWLSVMIIYSIIGGVIHLLCPVKVEVIEQIE